MIWLLLAGAAFAVVVTVAAVVTNVVCHRRSVPEFDEVYREFTLAKTKEQR